MLLKYARLKPQTDIFVYGSVNESLLKAGSFIIFLKIMQDVKQQDARLISWYALHLPEN
jgi:hypothetical protein